jgi:putative transcriptional regulator
MTVRRTAARWAAVAGLVVGIGAAAAAPSPDTRAPASRFLTGQLLVATEQIGDPRFAGTVVYMLRHDGTGAMGLVVNRPLAEVPVARLLDQFGLDSRGMIGQIRVHYGGPVQRDRGFVLHTADFSGDGTEAVRDGIAFTSHPGVVAAIGRGAGPRRALFAAGYSGWAAGQLEREIDGGAWFTALADEDLLFDRDHESKWERAKARRRLQL